MLSLILFLSKPSCIKVHLSLSNTDYSAFLSSGVRPGLIRVGDLKKAILAKAKVASVDRRNLTRIGLGHVASDLYMYLPSRKQSLTEQAWIGRSTLANSLVMDCKSFSRRSDFLCHT